MLLRGALITGKDKKQLDLEGQEAARGLTIQEESETVKYVTIKTGKLQLRMTEESLGKMLMKRGKDKNFRKKLQHTVRIRTDIKDMLTTGEWDKHFSILEKKIRNMKTGGK